MKSLLSSGCRWGKPPTCKAAEHILNEQSRARKRWWGDWGVGEIRRAWAWSWSRFLSTNKLFSLSETRNFLISRVIVNIWSRTLPHGLGYNSWTDKYGLNPKTENATHIMTYTSLVCEGLLSTADCISGRDRIYWYSQLTWQLLVQG